MYLLLKWVFLAVLPSVIMFAKERIACRKENVPGNRQCCVNLLEKEGKCLQERGIRSQNLTDDGIESNKYGLNSTNVILAVIGLSTFVILISVFLFRLWHRKKYNRNSLGGQNGGTPQINDYSPVENRQTHGHNTCSLATSAEYSTGLNLNEELYNQLELRLNNTYCKSVDMDCMEQQNNIIQQQLQCTNGENMAYSYSAGQNNELHTESLYDTVDDTNL